MRDKEEVAQMRAFLGDYARWCRKRNRGYSHQWAKDRWTDSPAKDPAKKLPSKEKL